jgi:purine-nucleoside phosphorylase
MERGSVRYGGTAKRERVGVTSCPRGFVSIQIYVR